MILLLALGCRPPALPPQSAAPERASLDAALAAAQGDLPSLAGAVASSAGVEALGAVGARRRGDPAAVTPADRYHLGSCTKAMTATLAAVLVEEGRVRWDTTLSEGLPGLEMHPDYQGVTLEMLLSHTGGAWGDTTKHPAAWGPLWRRGDVAAQRAAFAAQALAEPPEVPPGSAFLYSNAGYMLAGAVLEAAVGESWEDLLRGRVFAPLGMESCGFGPPDDGSLAHPWGHGPGGDPVDPTTLFADNPPALGPAGTVHCSLADWGRFAAAHLAGARGEGAWLRPETWEKLHAPVRDGYALGWGVAERGWAGGRALHHAGSNTMFYAVIWLAPEIDAAFLVATNIHAPEAADAAIGALIEARR